MNNARVIPIRLCHFLNVASFNALSPMDLLSPIQCRYSGADRIFGHVSAFFCHRAFSHNLQDFKNYKLDSAHGEQHNAIGEGYE